MLLGCGGEASTVAAMTGGFVSSASFAPATGGVGLGIIIDVPHDGHLPFLPALSAGAFMPFPQPEHAKVILSLECSRLLSPFPPGAVVAPCGTG